MPTIQPPAISDGRSKTHPRETELVEKPNKGIFAKYRLEDRDGVKQKVLVPLHEVAMTQPNDHQTIIWKLAEKVETIFKNRARHDMIMATFPSGYKFYHYLFETKAQKEARLNGQASKGKAKNKELIYLEWIVFYRKDPYLLGHPSGTSNRFRSTNEMKPHIIWLAYGLYATKNVQVPKSDVEWTCRDFALCPCGLCPKFLSKYETNFMDPLRSRMVLGANEEFSEARVEGRSKKLIGDRRGSEDQDGSDDVGSWLFENSMALYTGLDEIKKSASKWKKLNSHAILFGNEVIRIGDVLRQRRANDSGPLKSIVARQFVFRPDEPDFLVSGAQWTLDNRSASHVQGLEREWQRGCLFKIL
ncbi:hypothetical protein BC829DRAFT_419185 [Chytridium lagenaria]|nr:hypothetical protein BC829DRAFT_419185 [Chytridium lagenaria]